MRTASRRSISHPTAARRARVSRFPRPASTRMRVVSVSSRVKLPELPEARMETRKPMRDSPGRNLENNGRAVGTRQRVRKMGGGKSDRDGRARPPQGGSSDQNQKSPGLGRQPLQTQKGPLESCRYDG